LENEIAILKEKIISNDWNTSKISFEKLIVLKGEEYVFDFLISLLNSNDPKIRNNVALAIEDLKIQRALEPLLESIFKEENKDYNGTLVFALASLDCSQKIKEIFKILFNYAYEAKMSAISILDEQIFEFTKQDLLEIELMWGNCKLNPETCIEFNNLKVRKEMQSCVDSFLIYLEED
jgi:HEAT repeat protein